MYIKNGILYLLPKYESVKKIMYIDLSDNFIFGNLNTLNLDVNMLS